MKNAEFVFVLQNGNGEFARIDDNHNVVWNPEFRSGGFGTWGSCDKLHMEKWAERLGAKVVTVKNGFAPNGTPAIKEPSRVISFTR